METAQIIDAIPELEKKRPYLDQMSLPLAIQKAKLRWNILPAQQHYILGGRLRHKPFPIDEEIFTVHYRAWRLLKEAGLAGYVKEALQTQAGVKKIEHIEL